MMTVSPSVSRKVPMTGRAPRGRSGCHEQNAYTPGWTVGRKFRSSVLRSDTPGMTLIIRPRSWDKLGSLVRWPDDPQAPRTVGPALLFRDGRHDVRHPA